MTADQRVTIPLLDGVEISAMNERRLVEIWRHRIGYVFQSFGLILVLSAADNVEIPLRLVGLSPPDRADRVLELRDGQIDYATAA